MEDRFVYLTKEIREALYILSYEPRISTEFKGQMYYAARNKGVLVKADDLKAWIDHAVSVCVKPEHVKVLVAAYNQPYSGKYNVDMEDNVMEDNGKAPKERNVNVILDIGGAPERLADLVRFLYAQKFIRHPNAHEAIKITNVTLPDEDAHIAKLSIQLGMTVTEAAPLGKRAAAEVYLNTPSRTFHEGDGIEALRALHENQATTIRRLIDERDSLQERLDKMEREHAKQELFANERVRVLAVINDIVHTKGPLSVKEKMRQIRATLNKQ